MSDPQQMENRMAQEGAVRLRNMLLDRLALVSLFELSQIEIPALDAQKLVGLINAYLIKLDNE